MESNGFSLIKIRRIRLALNREGEQRAAAEPAVSLPHADAAPEPGYDGFTDYQHLLIPYKRTVLGFALAGLTAAILVSLIQTPLYRVRTSLEIQDFNPNFLDIKSVDPTDSTGNYVSAQSYLETQVKILQSESLLERVVDKLKLQQTRPTTGWRASASRTRRMFGFSDESALPEKEGLIREAERNLSVRASGNARLLEVLYESPDPKLAADFANTLVSEFIEQSQEMRWKSTQRTAEWLTSHLDEMKRKLEESEAQLQDYARTSGLSFTAEQENVAEGRLKELQEELSRAQADRVAKQAKFEEARSKSADSLPEVLDDPTLREYRLKLADLHRQLVELSATLTPAHYKVQRIQAQVAELESAVQTQLGNIRRRIDNEYATALRRERLLTEAYSQQSKTVSDQSGNAIHYDTLKRDVDSSRQLYEAMLQRVKQAGLAAAMRASNVLVVDPAKPPLLPYKPNLPMNSAIGLFSGLFIGFGFALLRDRLDRRIRVPGDAQVYLNLPELGVIPLAERPATLDIFDTARANSVPVALHSALAVEPPLADCPELAAWKRKPSLLAECVRTTLISFLLPDENRDYLRVVVFTSPCPGDGKTTVVSNLSIALTEIGRRVLLIDGDLRRPRLHKLFGVSNSWGLSDVLWADSPLETVPILHLVQPTRISGLSLLPGGSSNVIPSRLFYSPRMPRLLRRLRSEFDMLMVDAPPMLHLADARVLGRLADGVVLVIRAGQTTTESALFASQRFAEDGTRVIGTILNNWDPNQSPSYRYGYGYQDKY